ncbi:hypothetical protein [Nordella sp. HKS 07]|uniref:hypothetical protein n=1 Tax=Nordella sp. HKS 07 TaxID=2712222 RepID=UPI001FEDA090|nr:hypothetical protein [Nordella sp. HKS 07]
MKIGTEKTRLIQKRLRMSRTMACISIPAAWPISWAISCDMSIPEVFAGVIARPEMVGAPWSACPALEVGSEDGLGSTVGGWPC